MSTSGGHTAPGRQLPGCPLAGVPGCRGAGTVVRLVACGVGCRVPPRRAAGAIRPDYAATAGAAAQAPQSRMGSPDNEMRLVTREETGNRGG
jgi:hypothetical protein